LPTSWQVTIMHESWEMHTEFWLDEWRGPFFFMKRSCPFSVLFTSIIKLILKFTWRCMELIILILCSTKLPTVLPCPFKDGMPRNAWHLTMPCTMNGCSHMPRHSSKNWGGLHQKLPAVSSNSISECLKQNPQLLCSSNIHCTGCIEARNVHLNYCLQEMPTKQNQVKVSPPMVLPNWS